MNFVIDIVNDFQVSLWGILGMMIYAIIIKFINHKNEY
jgi:hypothetical protein